MPSSEAVATNPKGPHPFSRYVKGTRIPIMLGKTLKNLIINEGKGQDLEINQNYTGKVTEHHGKVEFYMRYPTFANYDVMEVVKIQLDELNIRYSGRNKRKYGAGQQIFLEKNQYDLLIKKVFSISQQK